MVRTSKPASEGMVYDPALRAAAAMAEGVRIPFHLCERRPRTVEEIPGVSLGTGLVDKKGGTFVFRRAGWCECLAAAWEGQLVITTPDYLPLWGKEGQKAKCGKLVIDAKRAN